MKKGIAASKGIAIGKAFIKEISEINISDAKIEDSSLELEKFRGAITKTREQLEVIKEKTSKTVGEEEALVFDAHIMLLEDPEFIGSIENEITENSENALKAIDGVTQNFLAIFESIDDEYMRERAADIKDVSTRIMNNFVGNSVSMEVSEKNTIIVAHDLTPSDTAQLDKEKICAFLTNIGGRTSHSAIMARTLEIPAIVGLGDITNTCKNGDTIIVDGKNGVVIINPSEDEIKKYEEIKVSEDKEKEELKKLVDVKTVSKSGKRVEIAANIGNPKDVIGALENGAEGVGLYRTEFLYMDRDSMPNEDEQFEAYKEVLEKMNPKPVVIRTLDIGGDKKLEYLPLAEEMNPFLGYRAIRLCLDRKDIFKVQLRALLRASKFGNLRVMFPMISSIEEYKEAMEVVMECKSELKKENIEYSDEIQWGIMIEIPSAAVMADEFAKHVDFFSIGTNDLIQYTLAADRMNEKVSYLYNPMHPAVLRLIKMVIDGAHSQGKWCGMCGEMAGDEEAIETLYNYGLDEFSMSASSILNAKKIILSLE